MIPKMVKKESGKPSYKYTLLDCWPIILFGAFTLLLIVAHLYNIVEILIYSNISHPMFLVSLSVLILNSILFLLVIERRRFAINFCIFVYAYAIILATSLFYTKHIQVNGLLLNLAIAITIILIFLKSPHLNQILSR